MRYLEICDARTNEHVGGNSQSQHPLIWQDDKVADPIRLNLVVRDRLLRIAEIMKALGFASTLDKFADRFLAMSGDQLTAYLSRRVSKLPICAIATLRSKLDIVHNTCADEIANSSNERERRVAEFRDNLIQSAYVFYDAINRYLG